MDAGTTLGDVTDDIEGTSRPVLTAFDIGAYEFTPDAVAVTSASLPDGQVGAAYSQTVAATGGVTPYTWSVSLGSLPAGLSLNAGTGEISGTPTAYGTSNFTVEVDDSQGTPDTDTQVLSITVIPADLGITTAALAGEQVGAAYSETVAATGGAARCAWSVIAGSLPAGLSLNAGTGVISRTPTAAETANFTVEVTDSWGAPTSDTQALSITILTDAEAPEVSGLACVPTSVREGVDLTVTITATADDSANGGSAISAAECFTGADPGEGAGTPLAAADGTYDTAVEAVLAPVDSSGWLRPGVTVYVRAMDAPGNWSAPVGLMVPVIDPDAPGRVTDLAATSQVTYEVEPATLESVSSNLAWSEPLHLVDGNTTTEWQSAGTTTEDIESIMIDLGEVKTISVVGLVSGRMPQVFPRDFVISVSDNGVDFTVVARVERFKGRRCERYIWEFEETDARYVKVTGKSVRWTRDRRYYCQLAEVEVPRSLFASTARLTWTAPGDDGYGAGPVSGYDIRWSDAMITEATFGAATAVTPVAPGLEQDVEVNFGDVCGEAYVALKAVDAAGNCSLASNVDTATVGAARIWNVSPADSTALSADTPVEFVFEVGPLVKPHWVLLSSSDGFPVRRIFNPEMTLSWARRFIMRPAVTRWTPAAPQWRMLKRIALSDGILDWKVAGRIILDRRPVWIYGPSRTVYFDTGTIAALTVSACHSLLGTDAVWPDVSAPPTFSWTNNTVGLCWFYVDISTDAATPMRSPSTTVTLGGSAGVEGPTCAPSAFAWRQIRRLAGTSDGMLYWRVRALDAERIVSCGSTAQVVKVDGGSWVVGALDLSEATPSVSWTHTGDGIAKCCLQVSSEAGFPPVVSKTVKVPAVSVTGRSITLRAAQKAALAGRNGVSELYYRVRGEDAQSTFVTYSAGQTTSVP